MSDTTLSETKNHFNLESIIDVGAVQALMDDFYDLTGIGVAILDLEGKILVKKGWQDICIHFHRVCPATLKNCIESDLMLSMGIEPGTFKLYQCKNHMLDMATPVVVGGQKVGNLYLGQFLFDDRPVDTGLFRRQARMYGFNEEDYLNALGKVPRWSRKTVNTAMGFYTRLAHLLSDLGHKNFQLRQSMTETQSLLIRLSESQAKYRELVENLNDMIFSVDKKGIITYVSPAVTSILGFAEDELAGRQFLELVNEKDRDRIARAFMDVLQGNLSPSEYRIQSKSGDYRWVRTSSRPIHKDGHITGLQGVLTDITDRRTAVAALQSSEETLRAMFDSSLLAIVLIDRAGTVLNSNEAHARRLEMTRDQILGRCIWDLLPPDVCGHRKMQVETVFKTGQPVTAEDKRGDIWNEYHIHPAVRNSHNEVKAVIVEALDITEAKKKEAQLRLHSLVLDQIHDHVTITDLDGVISYVNQAQVKTLGRPKEAFIGKPTAIYGEDPQKGMTQREIIDQTLHKGFWRGEVVNFDTAGSERIMDCRSQVVHDNQGKPIALCGIATDVTDYKRSEDNLKKIKTQLSNAMEIAQLGPWEYDMLLDRFIFNDQFYHLFYTTAEQAGGYTMSSGKYADQYVHPEDRDLVAEAIRKAVETSDPFFSNQLEHRILYADGSTGYISVRFFIVKDEKGKTIKTYGVNQDITARKELELRLQQAQKMEAVGTLAGGIAHDFNNILFPIIGHAELLLEDIPKEDAFRESLNEIYTSALRAKDLVQQILTFSRQGKTEPKLMKMQPIIKEVLKLIRSGIPTTISIRQDIRPDCGAIKADPTQIHQIVMNLATNAWHAMEDSIGDISVSLKEMEWCKGDVMPQDILPGLYACLTVADTGTGMTRAVMDRIFDPFFTTKAKGKGTGMGLSMVHGIIKSMDGAIQVNSEPGRGSEFHVYLPVVRSISEKQRPMVYEPLRGGVENILLVDDEKPIIVLEKQMLERLGYHITSYTSSVEALEAFRADPDQFDLVITDLAMPAIPGDRLAIELMKIRPGIPVLLCTGFSETLSEEKIESIGIRGFILKPIIIKDLAEKIRQILEKDAPEPSRFNSNH